jgi:hypothetical protein
VAASQKTALSSVTIGGGLLGALRTSTNVPPPLASLDAIKIVASMVIVGKGG